MASKWQCAYCGRWLTQPSGVKGRGGKSYCSARCDALANPETHDDAMLQLVAGMLAEVGDQHKDAYWWVCRMKGGGWFACGGARPGGVIHGVNHKIAAGSYDVMYGPCSRDEADEYIADMESADDE